MGIAHGWEVRRRADGRNGFAGNENWVSGPYCRGPIGLLGSCLNWNSVRLEPLERHNGSTGIWCWPYGLTQWLYGSHIGESVTDSVCPTKDVRSYYRTSSLELFQLKAACARVTGGARDVRVLSVEAYS